MLTYLANTNSRTTMTNSYTAMLRYSLLLAVAVLVLGCGSSSQTTELEERRPMLECDGGQYDEYLTVTTTAKSLQLDLVRRKVLARGQARLAGRVRSSLEGYLDERRPEVLQNSVASGMQAQATDSLESSINRAVGEVLAGSELIRCNTYVTERGEARVYEMDGEVGLPVGEAASKFAQRVGQNPTLQEAFEDQSAIRGVIDQWLRWILTQDVMSGGAGQSQGSPQGSIRN